MTETSLGGDDVRFQPTMWTTILRARDSGGEEARAAMGRLIERYWKPLYFFARRRGHDVEAAKDLAQAFFERVLDRDYLRDVAPEKGRFRNWLLAAMSHFLSDAAERERAAKRGGGRVVPLDVEAAERELAGSTEPPERIFARAWAVEVLSRAMTRLRGEWSDRRGDFDVLSAHLQGTTSTYADTAKQLGLQEHDVRNLLHRMRVRLRELLREEVAESLEDRRQADAELAELFRALSG